MDATVLRAVMIAMTTNDPKLQRSTVEKFLTPDVRLTHILGDARGRQAVYGVYRAAVTALDYNLTFKEVVVNQHAAMAWLDLNVAPLHVWRCHIPTVVTLRFRQCEDGLCVGGVHACAGRSRCHQNIALWFLQQKHTFIRVLFMSEQVASDVDVESTQQPSQQARLAAQHALLPLVPSLLPRTQRENL